MNVLSETYIFYADVYFIQNYIIKIAVLYLALYCNKFHIHISTPKVLGKVCLVSFLGTLVEIVGLLFANSYNLFLILVSVLEIPLMFLGIVGKEIRQMFRLILTGYFFLMLINSVVELLWNWFGETASFLLLLIFACGVVIVGVRIWKNYNKMQKGIFPVELSLGEKRVSIYGFYDSGNRLIDPYTGKGVHIVSEQVLERLGIVKQKKKETAENCLQQERITPVYVPYQALGNESGMLEVYYVDELTIEGEKQRITRQNCPLGVTKDNLFKEKAYEIILNEEVF